MSDDEPTLKIGLATPYLGTIPPRHAQCRAGLMGALGLHPLTDPKGEPVSFGIKDYMVPGSILPAQRNEIVDYAIKDDCSHLLWLDSDQTFPMDTLHRLLSHNKDAVGCNIARKSVPSEPTAFLPDGKPLYTRRDSTGLVRVKQVGTGVLLMRVRLFKQMLEKFNWPVFSFPIDLPNRRFVGEDNRMCKRLEAMGVEIWVDQDLSKQIGHIGEFEFKHEHIPGFYDVADSLPLSA